MYSNLLFFTTYVYDILCFCQLMYPIYSIFVNYMYERIMDFI